VTRTSDAQNSAADMKYVLTLFAAAILNGHARLVPVCLARDAFTATRTVQPAPVSAIKNSLEAVADVPPVSRHANMDTVAIPTESVAATKQSATRRVLVRHVCRANMFEDQQVSYV
jgi:hypothetical protein